MGLIENLDTFKQQTLNATEKWEYIHNQLEGFRVQAGADMQLQKAIAHTEDDIRAFRREAFHREYQQLHQQIINGQILNEDLFDDQLQALKQMARPDERLADRPSVLQNEYHRRQQVLRLRSEVQRATASYQVAIDNGLDLLDAAKNYLTPIRSKIEQLLQQIGEDPDVLQLLTDVQRAISNADRTNTHTLAFQAKFRDIIRNLQNQDDEDYYEVLVNEHGEQHGRLRRDEAILWYENISERVAVEKADKYRQQAEEDLQNRNPSLAALRIREAVNLFMLPLPKKQELDEFHARYIQPQLDRIVYARDQLDRVLTAPSLERAIEHYENARDEERGWSRFEDQTMMDDSGLNPAVRARDYIYTLIEPTLDDAMQVLSNEYDKRNITHIFTSADINRLESYFNWGDGRMRTKYRDRFTELKRLFNTQQSHIQQITQATKDANAVLQNGNHRQAYEIMRPWETHIADNPDLYQEAKFMLDKANALYNMRGIKDAIHGGINSGVDWSRPVAEADRLKALMQKGQVALDSNPTDANAVGLGEDMARLTDAVALLEGLHYEQQNLYEDALKRWRGIAPQSIYYNQAQSYIQNVSGLLHDDRVLNDAVARAKILLEQAQYESAYTLLIEHEGKRDVRNYTVLVERLQQAREGYGQQLVDQINQNIVTTSDRPAELKALHDRLQTVNPAQLVNIKPAIELALKRQTARSYYNLALDTRNRERWEAALDAYEELNEIEPQAILAEVREYYTEAYVFDVIEQSYRTDSSLDEMRMVLASGLRTIEKLALDVPDTELIHDLRLHIYVRLAQVDEDPDLVRKHMTNGRAVLKTWRSDVTHVDHTVEPELATAERLIELAENLRKTLVPGQRLEQWIGALIAWHEIMHASTQFVGLAQWYKRFSAALIEKLMVETDRQAELWQKAEPIAKRFLLSDQIAADEWGYMDELRSVARVALHDFSGTIAPEGMPYAAYLTELERAAWAIKYLASTDQTLAYDHLDLTGFDIDQVEISDLDVFAAGLAQALKRKAREVGQVQQSLRTAKDRLQVARSYGQFDLVHNALSDIFDDGGLLQEYRVFTPISEFMQVLQDVKHEYWRFKNIANQIVTDFQQEHFDHLLQLIEMLENDDKAVEYGADFMVQVEDRYASSELLDNTQLIQERVMGKIAQIEALITWLTDVVDRHELFNQIRDDEDCPLSVPQINLGRLNVVDFYALDNAVILPLRKIARYDQALDELDAIDLGVGGTEDQPARHTSGKLSIAAAQIILQNSPLNSVAEIRSGTAEIIYKWAALLWRTLQEHMRCVGARYRDLEQADEAFQITREQFMQAVNGYERSHFNRNQYREQIDHAYDRITGKVTHMPALIAATADGCDYQLEPLAPDWTGFDTIYDRIVRG